MRRRRNRRYYNNYDNDYSNSSILLADFMYFNKETRVIDEEVLNKIRERLETERIVFWTKKVFGENGIGFKIYKKKIKKTFGKNIIEEDETYIKIIDFGKELHFTPQQFNQCKHLINRVFFIKFALTEEQEDFLKGIRREKAFNKIRDEGNKLITAFNSWEKLMEFLIISNSIRGEIYWDDVQPNLKLLLNEYIDGKEIEFNITESINVTLKYIIKVWERRINDINYRIALVSRISYYSNEYEFISVKEDSEEYNLIDGNRFYFTASGINYYLADGLLEKDEEGKWIVNGNLFNLMERNIREVLGEGRVVTPSIFNFYRERVFRFTFNNNTKISEKQQKINDKYKQLLKEGKTIKLGKLIMKEGMIKVGEDFCLTFNKEDNFINMYSDFNNIREAVRVSDVQYNYNEMWERLLQISKVKIFNMHKTREYRYKQFVGLRFNINNIDVVVIKDGNRIKINNYFCRVDDVKHVLTKLICYRNKEDFDKYVKDVSYIGIEWKKMLSTGIIIKLSNPFYNILTKVGQNGGMQNLYMRFSLHWDEERRQRVYLILNGKKYLIRYKAKFKKYFNYPSRHIRMGQLKRELGESIEGINDKEIINIVANAIKEAEIVKKRGEELVQNTINDVKAIEAEITVRGSRIMGFKLTGRVSGGQYFIKRDSLDVYKFMNGAWNRRCVVDNASKDRIFEDRLANRLVNIYNEPSYISTIH